MSEKTNIPHYKRSTKLTPKIVVEMMKEGVSYITERNFGADELQIKQFVYGSKTLILSFCPKCKKSGLIEVEGVFNCECGSKFKLVEV